MNMVACRTDTLAEVFSEPRLFNAWEAVARKNSAPGIDNVSVDTFSRNVTQRLREIREHVLGGWYQPSPLVIFPREKPGGGYRELTITTVRDRVTARCAADALNRRFDSRLQPQSYAYRPRRSALRAVGTVQQACRNVSHVLRLDIASFFDSLKHSILRDRLREEGVSEAFVDLLLTLVRQPRFDGVDKRTPEIGLPQGSQLAPILSNLYLDPLDRRLNESNHRFVRYADDLVTFAASANEAGETLNQCTTELSGLGLKPNLDKTRIYRVDDGFLFLGFVFNRTSHVASPAARASLRQKIDSGAYDDEDCSELDSRRKAIVRGWKNYFESDKSSSSRKNPIMKISLSNPELFSRFFTDIAADMGTEEKPAPARGVEDTGDVFSEAGREEETADSPEDVDVPEAESVEPDGEAPEAPAPTSDQARSARLRELRERAPALLAGQGANTLVKELRDLLNDDPPPSESEQREILRLLASAYRALGLHGAAWRCLREAGDSPSEAAAELTRDGTAPIPFGPRDVDAWMEIFQAGPVYNQFLDRLGRSGYRPYSEKLNAADLKAHWQGKRTLAVSVYDTQGRVRFGVIDLDISRQTLDRLSREERDVLRRKLFADARNLLACAQRLGIDGVIEDSCLKGYHLWFFFRTPLTASRVRTFLSVLCEASGRPPEGSHRELFPASDTRSVDDLNSRIRLPLGVHRVTGERSRFLAPDGTPCSLGAGIPAAFATVTGQRLYEATLTLTTYRLPAKASAERSQASTDGEIKTTCTASDSVLQQVAAGCGVLRALECKAAQDRHLGHAERIILRGILMPLGEEGRRELHRILSSCANYNRATTEKYARAAHATPIGCARIREILGEFADQAGCACTFKPRKNSYPNPLRHIRTEHEPAGHSPSIRGIARSSITDIRSASDAQTEASCEQTAADDTVALLAAYRAARQNLLAVQRQLLSLAGGRDAVETTVGRLRLAGADTELLKWQIDLA